MLTDLHVRQFAVVDHAEIALGSGMTVVTGETGAGKSLLVDALLLLTGARADSGVVRAGAERAELSADFALGELPAASAWLREQALDDDKACQLRRVILADGGSRAWINGRPVSLGQLAELGAMLVEIHGQHEHQALLSRSHQLQMLDAYAGNAKALDKTSTLATQWRELGRRIQQLSGGGNRDGRVELLRHELDGLERWALPADALAELEATHKRLANADRLLEGSHTVRERLDGEHEFALRSLLGRTSTELAQLATLDPRLQPLTEMLDGAEIQITEVADTLQRYAQDLDLDPDRYHEIDTQLGELHDLSRRHRVPMDELLRKAESVRQELAELEGADVALAKLAAERKKCETDYATAADALSKTRKSAAAKLGKIVSGLMQELGMQDACFGVQLEPLDNTDPDPSGRERCELMVSANPGQPPRPLRKVASGGELSRISLAIEVAALGMDAVGTMVFDEVDAGIGGAVAEVVGNKLRRLGGACQVLCVTHLPQVAAQGHAHLKVDKSSAADNTRTTVIVLDAAARGEELARMLGGVEITRETRAHAKQLLDRAQVN